MVYSIPAQSTLSPSSRTCVYTLGTISGECAIHITGTLLGELYSRSLLLFHLLLVTVLNSLYSVKLPRYWHLFKKLPPFLPHLPHIFLYERAKVNPLLFLRHPHGPSKTLPVSGRFALPAPDIR